MVTRKRPTPKPARRASAARRSPRARKKSWNALNIHEKIMELGSRIPPEELARHPPDGAANLDHYLYGVPKQDPD